jgi:hypothetical protein
MRELVYEEGDPGLFGHLGVPRSTAVSWMCRGPRPVLSADILGLDQAELPAEVLALRRRIRFLLAIIRLAFLLVRLSEFAVVGHPSRDYLWILSRTPTMDPQVYDAIVARLAAQGYETKRLVRTAQPPA